jgi:hypothetical protein
MTTQPAAEWQRPGDGGHPGVESRVNAVASLFDDFSKTTCRIDDIPLYRKSARAIWRAVAEDAVLDLCERALDTGEGVEVALASVRRMRNDAIASLRATNE